eukprot:2741696-Amphidinium_carterae.2
MRRAEDEFRGQRCLGSQLPMHACPPQALFRVDGSETGRLSQGRRRRLSRLYVDMVASLNELSGHRDGTSAGAEVEPTDSQKKLSDTLAEHVRSFGLHCDTVLPSRVASA